MTIASLLKLPVGRILMAYTYSYNPLVGLSTGIALIFGASSPHNPSRKFPPHLPVDSAGFVGVNTRWKNPHFEGGRLLRSSLTTIEPKNGRSFKVFDAPRQEDDHHSIVFIDTSTPPHMKRRPDADIKAWTGIRGEGIQVVLADISTGAALLRCEPNASIEIFQFDGSVHFIRVESGKFSVVPLSHKQMANLRVEQFEEQIARLDLSLERDVRCFHGIIAGALRLVARVKDPSALDVLAEFMLVHQHELTVNLREQIRFTFLNADHSAAQNFLDGYGADNVVKIETQQGAAKRIALQKKKRERSERDRKLREAMRGGHGGSRKKQQKGKGKK